MLEFLVFPLVAPAIPVAITLATAPVIFVYNCAEVAVNWLF